VTVSLSRRSLIRGIS